MRASRLQPRVGYVPYGTSFVAPGDRRRFVAYARARRLAFEVARPDEHYDLVVLSELADFTVWSKYPHGKVVFDFIDSYLAIPRRNLKQLFRGAFKYVIGAHKYLALDYKKTLEAMCRRADAVVCTTAEQQAEIIKHCPNVHIVLDVHTAAIRTVKTNYERSDVLRIVWEGLSVNVVQLREIGSVLHDLSERHQLQLELITDAVMPRYFGRLGSARTREMAQRIYSPVVVHPWKEQTFSDLVCACDVAIIPIDLSDPFAAGKPENKLLLLWRTGIPVVASATPAYRRSMLGAGLDLCCDNSEDWHAALEQLIGDEARRRYAGEKGRAFVELNFNEANIFKAWDSVFRSIGFDFAKTLLTSESAASA